jgi:D-tyrosyl-tRNA(Tyr) deacylase
MNLLDAATYFAEQETSFDKVLFNAATDIVMGKCHGGLDDDDAQREAIQFMTRTDSRAARDMFASQRFWKPGNVATRACLSWPRSQPEAIRKKVKIPHPALHNCATWIEKRVSTTRKKTELFELRYWLSEVYRAMYR